jgi:hypothetical protein
MEGIKLLLSRPDANEDEALDLVPLEDSGRATNYFFECS